MTFEIKVRQFGVLTSFSLNFGICFLKCVFGAVVNLKR